MDDEEKREISFSEGIEAILQKTKARDEARKRLHERTRDGKYPDLHLEEELKEHPAYDKISETLRGIGQSIKKSYQSDRVQDSLDSMKRKGKETGAYLSEKASYAKTYVSDLLHREKKEDQE